MTRNKLTPFPRPAKRGSRMGWVVLSTTVPPELAKQLDRLVLKRGKLKTDLVREAVEKLVEAAA